MSSDLAIGATGATEFGLAVENIFGARTLTEDRFVAMGSSLEASIDVLGALTATFQALQERLDGDDIREATDGIAAAAELVESLARDYRDEQQALARIGEIAATIGNHVARMQAAVKHVDALGVSAKMEARHVSDANGDFQAFADEIDQFLKLTQVNFAALARELEAVRGHLSDSAADEPTDETDQADRLRFVPVRLRKSIETIAGHRREASAAAGSVSERAQTISARIGEAVMALQIGDITRQRIEHVEQGLDGLDALCDADPGTAAQGTAVIGRLMAAQLVDTAEVLDGEIERIGGSLAALMRDACDVADLGARAYGSSENAGGAFLLELETDVERASELLREFRESRERVDGIVEAVWRSAKDLTKRIGTIHSLQADFRIMGLNTMLKCGRLGVAGRPLSVIAQELRVCANLTAVEANAIIDSLERMNELIAGLSKSEQERRAGDIAAAADRMARSVALLDDAGHGLTSALETLRTDCDTVTAHLEGAVERITVNDEIGLVLNDEAARLERAANAVDPDGAISGGERSDGVDRLLEAIAASYTMAQERDVHARITGEDMPEQTASAPADADAEFEDIFF